MLACQCYMCYAVSVCVVHSVLFVLRPPTGQSCRNLPLTVQNTRQLAFPRDRVLSTWSPGSPGSRVVRSNSAACAFKTYYANTINVRAHSLAQPPTLFLRRLAYYCAVALASSSLLTSCVRVCTHCALSGHGHSRHAQLREEWRGRGVYRGGVG